MKEPEIFLAATQIEDQRLREAFIDSVCGGNPELRERVARMVDHYFRWGGALEGFAQSLPDRLADIRHDESTGQQTHENLTPDPDVSSQSPNYALQAGVQFASYEISSRLGAGGMGEIYLARDPRLDRHVAIKILPARHASNPAWIERFRREAQSASALNHPNILTIHEVGVFEGMHFMATEFVDGQTLRNLISEGSLSLHKQIDIAVQIAEALFAAHSAKIIHRDIKPDNVMLRRDGLVKVLDFGLAKRPALSAVGASGESSQSKGVFTTKPGMVMGTIHYMSPEQVRRQETDHRSDIFSFGVLLYEMFTGEVPFSGLSDADTLAAIMRSEPRAMRKVNRWLPMELEVLVMKMLRKPPEFRFQSAKEVAIDLRQVADGLTRADSDAEVKSSNLRERISMDATVEFASGTRFETPEVRYALSGQVNIAYQVIGKGEIDMVFVMGWVSHLEWFWKEPAFARFLSRLASFSRLILFDKRGTGLSDRVPQDQLPTLEQRMDDVRAVMDAVGSDKAVLCGVSEGGPMCSLFAATHPQKTIALAMIGCYARRLKAPEYPWGPSVEQHQVFLEEIRRNWGGPVGIEARAPSRASDPEFRSWWATYLRMGASPGAALALTKMNSQIDIRPILRTIQVPTIVVHRRGDKCLLFEEGKYLADNIPGAKLVELGGEDHLPFVGNQEEILEPIEEFLTGVKQATHIKRVLATVIFARVATEAPRTSSERTGLAMAHATRDVELFRGSVFRSALESFAATFDGPARAIRAALAIRDSATRLGVDLHLGVHTGEVEISEHCTEGPAVSFAKLIAERAGARDVLASSTVKDLVAGSDLRFVPQSFIMPAPASDQIQIYSVDH